MERGTLCLTFDNMGHAADVGRGLRAGPDADEADITLGYPNILALLDKLDIKATFFIEGWNAIHHPAAVRSLVDRGHEIGIHGWVHETFHKLNAIEAERVLIDALAAFELLGIRPRGFRAPGGTRGAHTVSLLKKHNIAFDSSVEEAAVGTVPSLLEGTFPNIPWRWDAIDYYQYYMHPNGARSPAQLEELFNERLEEAARSKSVVTLILHACVSGIQAERLEAIERVLGNAKWKYGLKIATAGEIAELIKPSSSRQIGATVD